MKTKLKKFGAWLLAATLAFAGAGAVQAETVAKIGETSYETLEAAIDAANAGDTVVLLSDVALEDAKKLFKSITIDFNGKTLLVKKGIATWTSGIVFKNGTLDVSKAVGDKFSNAPQPSGVYLYNDSSLELKDVEFVCRNTSIVSPIYVGLRAKFNVFDSELALEQVENGIGVGGYSVTTFSNSTVRVADFTPANSEWHRAFNSPDGANHQQLVLIDSTFTIEGGDRYGRDGILQIQDVVLDGSTVTIKHLQNRGITHCGTITLKNGAKINNSDLGERNIYATVVCETGCEITADSVANVQFKAGTVIKAGATVNVVKGVQFIGSGTIEKGANVTVGGNVESQSGATVAIADGKYNTLSGAGAFDLTGGVYKEKPADGYVNAAYKVVANTDESTLAEGYDWMVYQPPVAEVYDASGAKTGTYVTLAEAEAAAEDGQTIKVIEPGTYKLPDFTAQVTLESVEGVAYNCKDDLAHDGKQVCGIAKPVTFKGGSFDFGEHTYRGFIYKTGSWIDVAAKVTFDGAYIKGIICGHGDLEFKNCTIEQISSGQYPIRSWGSPTITFTGCTFLTGGRAILVYREGYPNSQQTVNVSGCHFLTKEGQAVDSKGAVQVNPADVGTVHYDVNIDGCDASEAYTGLWDVKLVSGKGPNALILIDGDQVYPEPVAQIGTKKYSTLAETLAAVQNNETVKVLKSGNVVTEYAKLIGEDGYSEGAGQNRLVFGTDAKFTLDLNGKTLTGRINFLKGDMTVTNGTLRGTSQVVNVFGRKTASNAEEAAAPYTTLTVAADCSIEGGNFGVGVFGGDQGNIYWPLGFGETVHVYGKVKALYGAICTSGNIGMDTYEDNIGKNAVVEQAIADLGMSVSAMTAEYGPVINVYDGAELSVLPGETEDSSQGISSQGMATYNIYGGKISGAEAIGVKAGIINVMGGEMTAFGVKANPIEAVNSGTEVSGGGIAVSTSYNGNSPIAVNVTGGTIKSANNAALLFEHSYDKANDRFCPVVKGVTFNVTGGTFVGAKDELAIKVEDAIEGDAATYPANFIWPELDEDGKETGYPLCSSRIMADYVAEGYVAKDNKNGTWTVTAGSSEIKTDTKDVVVVPTVVGDVAVTEAEKQAAAKEVKDDIVKAMKDPEVSDLVGTGLKENVFEQDAQGNPVLKDDVVDQLKKQAVQDKVNEIIEEKKAEGMTEDEARQYANEQKPVIETKVATAITKNSSSNTESHVEVKLETVEVAVSKESTESTVVEATLTKVTFEIKPIVTLVTKIDEVVTKTTVELKDGEELANPVLVRLWLNAEFIGTVAKVTHKHKNAPDEIASAFVQTGVNEKGETRKYVEVFWQRFSEAIVEAEDVEGKACLANGKLYETVAAALADTETPLPADAVIELLADCNEQDLALGDGRTIKLNGHAFTGTVATGSAEKEMVKTKGGEVYVAPAKVEVPTGDQMVMPIRGYAFPSGVTTPEEKADYLAGDSETGNKVWQDYALFGNEGTRVKLTPEIVKAAPGFSTVVIRAKGDYVLSSPVRGGVAVSFQLLKRDGVTGNFAEVGAPSATPSFTVDVKEIGPKTYWKIKTIFSCEEEQ